MLKTVSDLQPGDMLDLQNLNLPGAFGLSAECEMAEVEGVNRRGAVYTDLVNLESVPTAELEPSPGGGWRFVLSDGRPRPVSWTW